MNLQPSPVVEQQPYSREPSDARIQRERDQAVAAEWHQIDRVLRVLATALDAIGAKLGEARETIVYDQNAAIEIVDEQRQSVIEVAAQLRTARLNPDANQERKAAEAAKR